MGTSKKTSMRRPHKYAIMSHEKRMTFINMVTQQGLTAYRAAKMLSINNSTAKAIMRKYKQSGQVSIRKQKQNSLQQQQYSSIIIQNKEQTVMPINVDEEICYPLQENTMPYSILFPINNNQIYYYMPNYYSTPFWIV